MVGFQVALFSSKQFLFPCTCDEGDRKIEKIAGLFLVVVKGLPEVEARFPHVWDKDFGVAIGDFFCADDIKVSLCRLRAMATN